VRLAATYAIDREAMNRAERLGCARVTWSLVPPSFEFYWQPPGYGYDPAKARQASRRRWLSQRLRHRRLFLRCGADVHGWAGGQLSQRRWHSR